MMRINEKNLCNFSVSKTPIDKEGWLNKKGETYKVFHRRWFVLKGNLLFYFEKKEDKEPLGLIVLEGGTVELAEDEDIHAFKLVFHGANCRTYVLSASDQDSTEEWIKALATASYKYIKLMVLELQRQLDDINETEEREKNSQPLISLPSNSSDTCLYAHSQSSKNQRFNPFNEVNSNMSIENNLNDDMQTLRISSATSDSNLANYDTQTKAKSTRSMYTFLELHEYYGQIFRRVFEENRKKREAAKEEQLIVFD